MIQVWELLAWLQQPNNPQMQVKVVLRAESRADADPSKKNVHDTTRSETSEYRDPLGKQVHIDHCSTQ